MTDNELTGSVIATIAQAHGVSLDEFRTIGVENLDLTESVLDNILNEGEDFSVQSALGLSDAAVLEAAGYITQSGLVDIVDFSLADKELLASLGWHTGSAA